MQSFWIRNYTPSGQDRPKCCSSWQFSNNSDIMGIEWAVAGICMKCLAGAKQCTTCMVAEYGSSWLWQPREWSPPTLGSGANVSPAWLGELTKHHDDDDLPDSGVLWGPFIVADREWTHITVCWTIILDSEDNSSRYTSLDSQPT